MKAISGLLIALFCCFTLCTPKILLATGAYNTLIGISNGNTRTAQSIKFGDSVLAGDWHDGKLSWSSKKVTLANSGISRGLMFFIKSEN